MDQIERPRERVSGEFPSETIQIEVKDDFRSARLFVQVSRSRDWGPPQSVPKRLKLLLMCVAQCPLMAQGGVDVGYLPDTMFRLLLIGINGLKPVKIGGFFRTDIDHVPYNPKLHGRKQPVVIEHA